VSWLQLRVVLRADQVESIEALVLGAGAVAVTLQSHADEVVLEPDPGAMPLWHAVILEALFDLSTDLSALRHQIASDAPELLEKLSLEFVAAADWHAQSRQHSLTELFAERLWLLPKDVEPSRWQQPGQVVMQLEPGMAFGSGSHPTTHMCLAWLAQSIRGTERVLDFGCGSGVLAIAAAVLGAQVIAVDHDPQAVTATVENAAANALDADELRVFNLAGWEQERSRFVSRGAADLATGVLDDGPFDVIVANILAAPLIQLAPEFLSVLRSGGQILLTGILVEQTEAVMAAYPDVSFSEPIRQAEWACLAGTLSA
tara:strand:- start:381 stop:1325 length:945 start_codon:yes stop_codon:yes gene_type:complete